MPGKDKIKVVVGGQEVLAVRVHVTTSQENFNTYVLEDGATLRLKVVVTEILRAESLKDAEGGPLYLVKSQNVLATQHPNE